jgi:hypothetical protein
LSILNKHQKKLEVFVFLQISPVRSTLGLGLAEALGIDQSQIVPESSFWDSLESNQPKVVGLVVYHSDLGFRTLCKWRQTWTLRDIELLQLGSFASVCFNTEVAIGNILDLQDHSTDNFVVITPSQPFYRAYAITNTDVFDTMPVDGELHDIRELVKQVRTTS